MLVVDTYISQAISILSLKMSDPAAAAAAAPSAKKVNVAKKSNKAKTVKKGGPKFADMIVAAIVAMKAKNGSSRQAIQKYIPENNKVGDNARRLINAALKRGLKNGTLINPNRAKGSYKVAEVKKGSSKPKRPKKSPASKKGKKPAAAKKPAKKPKKKVAKKVAKKPAGKPVAKPVKPVAKKPAAKKAKKAAPKKEAGAKKVAKK